MQPVNSKIADIIYDKLQLGQMPDDLFFHSLTTEYGLASNEVETYKLRWNNLISFEFTLVNNFKDDVNDLLEIQGHHPEFIDYLFLKNKQQFTSDINLNEWKNILNFYCLKEQVAWNIINPFASFTSTIAGRACRITLTHEVITNEKYPKFFIRFHQKSTISLKKFILDFDPSPLMHQLKEDITIHKKNILLCGATGSGKTTLLKSLSEFIPEHEHLITIEDTAELYLERRRLTSLIAQAQLHDDAKTAISMDQLCTYAMRMTPDRLILGEIRGKEILSLALMLNTGHKGLLATVHASGAMNALQRLAMLFCLFQKEGTHFNYHSALKFLSEQFQRVVFVKDKKIHEIIKIIGAEQDNVFYETLYSAPQESIF